MSELADRLVLSRSGVTRLIDRLRGGCAGRAHLLRHRPRAARGRPYRCGPRPPPHGAAPTHLRGVGEHFLDRIPPAELDALQRTLDRVLDEV